MREDLLRRFFLGEAGAQELARDLKGAVTEIDPKIFRHHVEPMDRPFAVTPAHLRKLCLAIEAHDVPADTLQAIAFCLIASENFHYDDKRIKEVLFHWDNPEINFPFNERNLGSWKRALAGECDLDFQTADGRLIRLFSNDVQGRRDDA